MSSSSPTLYIPGEHDERPVHPVPTCGRLFSDATLRRARLCIYLYVSLVPALCAMQQQCVLPALCVQLCAGLHVRIAVYICGGVRLISLSLDGERATVDPSYVLHTCGDFSEGSVTFTRSVTVL